MPKVVTTKTICTEAKNDIQISMRLMENIWHDSMRSEG